VGAGLACLLAASGGLPLAGAQDGAQRIGIREVDATDPDAVKVTFFYAGDRADLARATVRENGRRVDATAAVPFDDSRSLGVVIVMDASGSMATGALIERVREAAHAFVDAKSLTDQIAIVSFNREVRLVQGFTNDKGLLDAALDSIALDDDTSLYDGILRAASLFRDTTLQPNILVFSDGGDTTSRADKDQAQAAVTAAGGALFAVGVENPGFAALADIARATGGSSSVADDPSGVGALFEGVQTTLRKQYVLTYKSEYTGGGAVPIDLTVDNNKASAEYVTGSNQSGAASLRPQVVEKPSGPAFFRTSAGLALALGLVALAVLVGLFSVGLSFFGGDGSLGRALRPYAEGYVANAEGDDADGDRKGQKFAQTAFLKRAVHATGQFAERQGVLTKIEAMLERANLPLRPAEAIFFYAIGVVVLGLALLALVGSPAAALLGVGLAALVPPAILSFLAERRRKQFESLLPDTLQLMASTLRAGYSLMQGVEAVSQEVSEPMGRELRRVVTEARLGRPLEEALDGISARMDSADFAWGVMAIRIQREVGGNLAELLVTVADTMTERERLRRDVKALTAEGKISAIVLGILPVGLGGFIYSINPEYMDPLFHTTTGKIMLFGSVGLALFGFWWMKKTIEIDI
jgi:tight adherence protein B